MAGIAHAQEGAEASLKESRYILSMTNKLRQKNRLKKWTADSRLMIVADNVARKIVKYGMKNYKSNWLAEPLRKIGYSSQSTQIIIQENSPSREKFYNSLLKDKKGSKFLKDKMRTQFGFAYLSGSAVRSNPRLSNIRIAILAEKTKQAGKNWAKDLLKYINKFRRTYNLPPLKPNKLLSRAAQAHVDDMAIKDFFAHKNLRGKDHGYRAQREGYKYQVALENLAVGQSSPEEVVEAWKLSKDGHREAMINRKVTEIGLGYRFLPADGGKIQSYHYWAITMAKPR